MLQMILCNVISDSAAILIPDLKHVLSDFLAQNTHIFQLLGPVT